MGILNFCEHCGDRKVRDVKEELEKLLQTKVISSHQCGLCLKLLAPDRPSVAKDISLEKSIVSNKDTTVDNNEHAHNDEDKNKQQQLDAGDVSTKERQLDCSDVSTKDKQQLDCSDVSNKSFKSVERRTRLSTGTIKLEPIQGLDSEDENDSVDIPFDSVRENSSADETKRYNLGVKSSKKRKKTSSGVKKEKVQKTCKSPGKKSVGKSNVKPELSDHQLMLRRALHPKLLPMIDMDGPPTKAIVCKECKMAFIRVQDFISHIRCHTGEELSIPKPYVCPKCSCFLLNLSRLDRHMATHDTLEKTYICQWDNCGAKFGCQLYLDKHIRRHKGDNKRYDTRKYQCSMCNHKRKSKAALLMHENTHTNARPFKCSVCDDRFNNPTSKRNHERNKHNKEKRYTCELCGFSSFFKQDFMKHQMIHSGDKPFPCDQCEYRCNRRDNLRKHLKIHSGERKAYKCSSCDLTFQSHKTCRTHEKSHLSQINQAQQLEMGSTHQNDVADPGLTQNQTQSEDWVRAVNFLQHLPQT
ncbi:uncharacterized protein [Amphiura filiformis]|uniref:uncharacterized protein n=1 Tax=Amphiura filiformis TaxID=82378 RepID=UPI003B21ADB0